MGVLSGWVSLTGVISVLLMCKALCVSANDMNLQVAAKVTETSGHNAEDQAGALRHTSARLMYSMCVLHLWFCALITSLVKTPAALTASEPSFACLTFCIWGCGCGKAAQQWCVGTLVFTLCLCVFQVWMVLDSFCITAGFIHIISFFVQIICFQMIDQRKFRNGRKRVWGTGWWARIKANNWQMDA